MSPLFPDDRPRPTLEDVCACVQHLFCEGADAELAFSDFQDPKEVIPGLLYRFPMKAINEFEAPRTLTCFVGLPDLAQRFWRQEVRVLQRLRGIEHAALPEIHDGGIQQIDAGFNPRVRELAYVVTEGEDERLDDEAIRAEIRANPALFTTRFFQLADALVALHRDGLLHRNIQPASIARVERPDTGITLGLRRFEMSSLQADLLRRRVDSDGATVAAALTAFLEQGRAALACVAPERLEYVFGATGLDDLPEQAAGDVFSLGVVAFQCLVGELEPEYLEAAFPEAVPGSEHPLRFDRDGWTRLGKRLGERVRAAPIGRTLQDLLGQMLEADPKDRLSSFGLLRELTSALPSILEELSPPSAEPPPRRLVAIEPAECGIFQKWGWISGQPLSTPDGRRELLSFLEHDLEDAWLEHAPDELLRFHPSARDLEEMKKAQWVLRGRLGFYYGHRYENRRPERPGDVTEFPKVFMLRYALRRDVVTRDPNANSGYRLGQRVAPLRFVARWAEEVRMAGSPQSKAPSWKPVMNLVTTSDQMSDDRAAFGGALRWLLEYQRVEIEARRYPFTREDVPIERTAGGRRIQTVRLRYDPVRDAAWRSRDPMRNLFTLKAEMRPEFSDFFGAPEDYGFDGMVRWWPDLDGNPNRSRDHGGRGEVEPRIGRLEPDCIEVRLDAAAPVDVPEKGWIEPADDEGQLSALRHQEAAVRDLADRKTLVAKLLKPSSFMRPGEQWREAAEGLIGPRSPAVLRRMLAADTIYVLQGPPGTGKTTVVARAIRQALIDDPAIRILVSAQSHYALDNLALSIARILPKGVLALRIASEGTETRVTERIRKWTRKELMRIRPEEVAAAVADYFDAAPSEVKPILAEWAESISALRAEIVDRTHRGANLVFSTCLQASETGLVVPGRSPLFDWVVIEEAAKALPTELAIPLVRGARWTLVGDHKQLPAYKARERREFLVECIGAMEDDPGLAPLLERADRFPAYFNLFAKYFDEGETSNPEREIHGYDRHPVDALNLQFRMMPPIGNAVRDAFYPGRLENGERSETSFASAVTLPAAFEGARLVWLDTSDEPYMTGDGERSAGEVEVIRRLVEAMWGSIPPAPDELAILSPYRRQRRLLMDKLPEHFQSLVHTVDSFQGREAKFVIISLVRGYLRFTPKNLRQKIGHLADEARVNVLMSRARDYLVLVGQYDHFRDAGATSNPGEAGAFWATLCEHFAQNGRRLPTHKLFGTYPGDEE
jgi:serine/threonine protein kinase